MQSKVNQVRLGDLLQIAGVIVTGASIYYGLLGQVERHASDISVIRTDHSKLEGIVHDIADNQHKLTVANERIATILELTIKQRP